MESSLVSVILLTYNHQAYIVECLESVISQKTDFKFEIVIGNDFSADNTTEICEMYAKKYPDLIKLEPRTKNLGLPDNLIQTIALAKGKLIAFVEGDDYWLDKNKLQKQVDILLNNSDYVACTHNSKIINIDATTNNLIVNPKSIYDLHDSNNGRIFHTNSWLIRREALPDFKNYFQNLICWDILMELKILEKGHVFFLNETLSIWRKHEGGNSVKIPLQSQFYNFESLYIRLLNESVNSENAIQIQHYRITLRNFYSIFALEIARTDKTVFIEAIWKSVLWQLKTLKVDWMFLPKLVISLIETKKD